MEYGTRLHIILFVTLIAKRVTCAQLHYFHKMQISMLILSQDTQERIAQNHSCDKSFSFGFSFSRSLALLSRSISRALSSLSLSRALFLCLSLSFTQSLPLSNSICHPFISPSLLRSFSLFPFVSLSHFLSFLSR